MRLETKSNYFNYIENSLKNVNRNEEVERIKKEIPKEKNLNENKKVFDSKEDEKKKIEEAKQAQELKVIEQKVIAHEMAHVSVGGKYAGSASYSYTKGPDGNSYITGGEVAIDTSAEKTPEETVKKMQQVRAAALAPAEPSPQDIAVAGKAMANEIEAQRQLSKYKENSNIEEIGIKVSIYA